MIAFFILERAVHELSYELANRPDWASIPLKGILDILAKVSSEDRPADD
jgi:maltose alpha-D-glucosyltransferase/alpha-amylase